LFGKVDVGRNESKFLETLPDSNRTCESFSCWSTMETMTVGSLCRGNKVVRALIEVQILERDD
jgi:hypothetical protein